MSSSNGDDTNGETTDPGDGASTPAGATESVSLSRRAALAGVAGAGVIGLTSGSAAGDTVEQFWDPEPELCPTGTAEHWRRGRNAREQALYNLCGIELVDSDLVTKFDGSGLAVNDDGVLAFDGVYLAGRYLGWDETDAALDFIGSAEWHPPLTSDDVDDPPNAANAPDSVVAGGTDNVVESGDPGGAYGTIGGGRNHTVSRPDAVVSGGNDNAAIAVEATVGGGGGNTATGDDATVAGGHDNSAQGASATVAGGENNLASGAHATVGGGGGTDAGDGNTASGQSATVAGGRRNQVRGDYGMISGGYNNRVVPDARFGTIAGGGDEMDTFGNTVYDHYGTIGGGLGNEAGSPGGNPIVARYATVAGGSTNNAAAAGATVGGGRRNDAVGSYATIPGGFGNDADGDYSFASGRFAHANHDGTLVVGDSSESPISSGGADEARFQMELYAPGFNSTSARTAKTNLDAVDPTDVLKGVVDLDVSTWEYREHDAGRHMGPMAEDFQETFGLGTDEKSISTVDADGVALAAIQGLMAELAAKDDRIDELEARLAAVEAQVGDSEDAQVRTN